MELEITNLYTAKKMGKQQKIHSMEQMDKRRKSVKEGYTQ